MRGTCTSHPSTNSQDLTVIGQQLQSISSDPRNPRVGFLVFVKAPQSGQVKTRLAVDLGAEQACELYRCFGLDLLAQLRCLSHPIQILYAPSTELATVQTWLGTDYPYTPQSTGDLGQRMEQAFCWGFTQGFEHLLILGSDSPDLPVTILEEAIAALAQGAIVIGPSTDGGYYCLGFTQQNFYPAVFAEMVWSTPQVFAHTWERLSCQPYPIHVLPDWFDIDTIADLSAYSDRHQGDSTRTMNYLRTCLQR
jgi:uncharacterized protein